MRIFELNNRSTPWFMARNPSMSDMRADSGQNSHRKKALPYAAR
jgi:hypothetical protein